MKTNIKRKNMSDHPLKQEDVMCFGEKIIKTYEDQFDDCFILVDVGFSEQLLSNYKRCLAKDQYFKKNGINNNLTKIKMINKKSPSLMRALDRISKKTNELAKNIKTKFSMKKKIYIKRLKKMDVSERKDAIAPIVSLIIPVFLSSEEMSSIYKKEYKVKRTDKDCCHWTLCIINISSRVMFWMDSLKIMMYKNIWEQVFNQWIMSPMFKEKLDILEYHAKSAKLTGPYKIDYFRRKHQNKPLCGYYTCLYISDYLLSGKDPNNFDENVEECNDDYLENTFIPESYGSLKMVDE